MKLAVMTIGILKAPQEDPAVQGFFDRVTPNYEAAANSVGFIDRANRAWGPIEVPKCWKGEPKPGPIIATLSLWDDVESVAAYSYHGKHGEAFGKRKEWFVTTDLPGYVAWWIENDHQVTWPEASERFESLHENGPTAFAFNFVQPFNMNGQPTRLLGAKVRERWLANEERQSPS